MTETLKILGQLDASAATATTLYTVPASTATVVSKIFICNRNASYGVKIRVWVAVNGAGDTASQYIYYDFAFDVYTSLELTLGLALGAGDLLRVQSDTASVSFSAFGVEMVGVSDVAKVLGQSAPAANTATTLYTVPASKAAVLSSLCACNQNVSSGPTAVASGTFVRIWIAQNGAGDDVKQYLFYDYYLGYTETLLLTPGIALAAGDLVRVQAGAANVSFNVFGMEMAA